MNSPQPITVAQSGIGPIAAEIARPLLTKPWIKVVAAVDSHPKNAGRDLGDGNGAKQTGVKSETADERRNGLYARCADSHACDFNNLRRCESFSRPTRLKTQSLTPAPAAAGTAP